MYKWLLILIVFCSCSAVAQNRSPASTVEEALQKQGIATRSQASLAAEARVRETETIARLTTEGQALYNSDEKKLTGYQYCSNAFSLAAQGDFRSAVREASKALFLGQQQRNEDLVAHAKRDLAVAYSYAGNTERAQQYAEEALALRVNAQDRTAVHAWAYKILGDVAARRGEFTKAVDMYQKSFGLNDGVLRFFARASLANVRIAAGDLEKSAAAVSDAESYLDILSSRSRTGAQTGLLRTKGNLALKQGKPDEAQQYFAKAIEQSGGDDQDYQRFWALEGQARALVAQGNKTAGLEKYVEALAVTEKIRGRFRNEEFNTGLFGEMQQAFDQAIRLAMEAGQNEVAWEISERGRSRALLDLVRNRVKLVSGENVFTDRLGRPVKLTELQALLTPNEAVVEYHVLDMQTYAWVIRRSSLDGITVNVKREEIGKLVESLRNAISEQRPAASDLGTRLYGALIRPLSIKDGESLVIVPHDALHYLPFQALRDADGYLVQKRAISYAPSAGALSVLLSNQEPKSGKLLALGNPDLNNPEFALPGAQREVEEIKRYFPNTEAYLLKDATKRRLMSSAATANTVHIAAHAEVDALDPLYSRIRLAPEGTDNGVLEAREVYAMDLRGSGLVTLSACESGLGKVSKGDEIWGFTRSFLSAGSPAVMVSLWPVADESTELLMTRFYQNLGKSDGRAALREAQLEVMKDSRFSHPFFWAPFNLIGDWR